MLSKLEKYMILILSILAISMSILVYMLYVGNLAPKCYNDNDGNVCAEPFTCIA